jgi:thiol-disulfide isomerase/thioredoxin
MPISREQFAQGMTAEEWLEQKVEANRERFLDNIRANTFSFDDRQFFTNHPVSIAAFGEDWCTDVVQFMPVAIKLAEEVPAVKLRIFERDDNLDLMEPYFKEGKYHSIPTFVVYDEDWNELGHFIERPEAVTRAMAEETRRFQQANSDLEGVTRTYDNMPDETRLKVRANSSRFRWDNMEAWNRIFLDELKAIVAGGVTAAR